MPTDLATFYSRTQGARKIIVVDLGFLGDTIHLLPALWELKQNYPQAALHVLTSEVGCEVLAMAACVDRAWPVALDPAKRSLGAQLQLVRQLRREKFDIAFNFSGADRTIFMTALSGAKWRVAHPGGRRHFWDRWLVPEWTPRQDPNLVVYEQRRRILADCGLKLGPVKFGLQLPPQALEWAAKVVLEWAVHISPCSAKATREWPLEHHSLLLRELWERVPELRVVVTAGSKPRERERLQQLSELVKDSRLELVSEALSISQLAALLSRCRLHIGPDSGVLHLAVALGVPTVSFFREQGHWKSFMPTGPLHRVISMPCRCIDHQSAPCEKLGRAECFEQITPARVATLVLERLSKN